MADTRPDHMGVRSPRMMLKYEPGPPAFFDNYAVCPFCNDPRPLSERDETVHWAPESAAYRCDLDHAFTTENALWDTVPR